jgi:hypothetical protein
VRRKYFLVVKETGSSWASIILPTQEAEIRRTVVQDQPKYSPRALTGKIPTQNRADGDAKVLEYLPSKPKALSSNSRTAQI